MLTIVSAKKRTVLIRSSQVSLLYLIVSLLVTTAFASDLTRPLVKAFFSTPTPQVGENFTYTVEISWEGDADTWRIPAPRLELKAFTLQNVSQSSERELSKNIRRYTYHLTATEVGKGEIGSTNIFCYPKGSELAETVLLPGKEVVIRKTILHSPPKSGGIRLATTGIIAIVFALIVFSAFRLRKNEKVSLSTQEVVGLEDQYLQKLQQMDLSTAQSKTAALANLTHLFRRYLAERYDLASKVTLDRFLDDLGEKSDWSLKEKQWIRQLFLQAQEQQFSGAPLSEQNIKSVKEKIESFLQSKRIVTT